MERKDLLDLQVLLDPQVLQESQVHKVDRVLKDDKDLQECLEPRDLKDQLVPPALQATAV